MGISLENLFMSNKSIQTSQTGGANQAQSVNSAVNQLLQNMFSRGDVISGKVSSLQGNVVELLLIMLASLYMMYILHQKYIIC